jgi:predicted RNase H-like nuclease (RuvC/YqgF family)
VTDLTYRVTTTESERETLRQIIAEKEKEIERLTREKEKEIQARDIRIKDLTDELHTVREELDVVKREVAEMKQTFHLETPAPDISPDPNGEPPPAADLPAA